MKPFLREKVPVNFEDVPDTTSFEAGYLVTKNAGWRNVRPVIDTSKCIGCLSCYLYCPDGVIFKKDGKVAIDYDFCKGCGICKKACKIKAIRIKTAASLFLKNLYLIPFFMHLITFAASEIPLASTSDL